MGFLRMYFSITGFLIFLSLSGYTQEENLVEVTGKVVMEQTTAPIPGVVISVDGTDRGVQTNANGMFTIVLNKGERCTVEGGGFKSSGFSLPADYQQKYYTITIPLKIDTIYLEGVTIRQMTPREFDFAFKYGYNPDEMLAASRSNMSPQTQAIMMSFMQRDGNENQTLQQMNNYMRYGSQYGQPSGTNLGNPSAWRDFIQAWKRGDFKGTKKN